MNLRRTSSAFSSLAVVMLTCSLFACSDPPCESGLPRYHGACVMRCPDPRYQCSLDGGVIDGAPMLDAAGFDVPLADSADATLDVVETATDAVDVALDIVCAAGRSACAGNCVDLSADPSHCGLCSMACPNAAHGTAACTMGTCGLTCESGFHACGANCADDTSPTSCGTSCMPCPAPMGARATCSGGTCGWECLPGFVLNAGACVLTAPRPLRPLSGSWTTTRRPSFAWSAPSGVDGAEVEVCRDRACGTSVMSFAVAGTTGVSPSDLPVGMMFWRLRGRSGGTTGTATSVVWELEIRPNAGATAVFGTVPDLNGDGRADAIVAGTGGTGTVYFFPGSASGLSSSPVTIGTPPRASGFGQALAAGDINGDGFVDLVVGASGSHTLHVYSGQTSGPDVTPAQTIVGPTGAMNFASMFSSAGDVNEDGYADVVVSDSYQGRAYLFLGSATGLQDPPAATLMTADQCGGAVASGDFDLDGHADVAIANSSAGRICLIYGDGASLMRRSDVIVGPGFGFGSAIGAADLDADGRSDIVVASGTTARAYLGSASGIVTGTFATAPIASGLGQPVIAGGDANGDGVSDVIIGGSGAVILYGGAGGLAASRATAFVVPSGAMYFGSGVSIVGDATGDRAAEVLVGARNSNGLYLYLGSPLGIDGTRGTQIAAPTGASYFGSSIL